MAATTNVRINSGRFCVCEFTADVIKGRWFMVFASFLIMTGAGATYLFGTYSKAVKSSQGYDQSTLNLLGFFKDLGGSVGVLSGLIAEVTPTWFMLLLGSVLNFVGYFMIWLAVTGRVSKPKVWQMCLYICVGANSANFANTGAIVSCVKTFPQSRGALLGLLKGYLGLSGAIMTQLYLAIYGNDSESLILLIAWLPAAISVVFVYTIRVMKVERQPNELKVFYQFLYGSLALAAFLMAMIIAQKQIAFSKAAYVGSATLVFFLLFLPVFIVIRQELRPENTAAEVIIEKPQTIEYKQMPSPKNFSGEKTIKDPNTPFFANVFNKPERGEDFSILQALLSIDMFILLVLSFIALGASLTAIDNLGQIGESLGYTSNAVSSFVSLVSIWIYFGRVLSGFASDILIQKYKVPRPLMLTLSFLLSCIGFLLIAFPAPGSVYAASILVGFSYGIQLPLFFAIVSELFGLKYFATLSNCSTVVSPLGTYILNVKVTGFLYDREARKQLKKSGKELMKGIELTCIGTECYRLPFIILASVTLLGALISLILVMRTLKFYKSDIYKKFRAEATGSETELATASSVHEEGVTNGGGEHCGE